MALPSRDMSAPLSDYRLQATRDKNLKGEKICKGEFIDCFFPTLPRAAGGGKVKQDLDEKKEVLRCRKVDRNWANWAPGFLIYE